VAQLNAARQLEFSCHWPDIGRFRGHYYQQQGEPAVALRPIPLKIPTMNELRLPAVTKRLCTLTQGLVVVTGLRAWASRPRLPLW